MSEQDRATMLARLGPPFLDPMKIAAVLVAPLKRVVQKQSVADPHARIKQAAMAIEAIKTIRSASAKRAWRTSPLLRAKKKK